MTLTDAWRIQTLELEIRRFKGDLSQQAVLTGGPSESLDKALKENLELRRALMKIEAVSNDTIAVRIARCVLEGE